MLVKSIEKNQSTQAVDSFCIRNSQGENVFELNTAGKTYKFFNKTLELECQRILIPPIARNQFDNRVFLDVPCGEVTDQVFMLFAKAMLYYLETTLRKDGFECEGLFVQSGLQENSASENTF